MERQNIIITNQEVFLYTILSRINQPGDEKNITKILQMTRTF